MVEVRKPERLLDRDRDPMTNRRNVQRRATQDRQGSHTALHGRILNPERERAEAR